MTSLSDTIAALTDHDAIRVLAGIADYEAPLPDPAQLRAIETGLREATTSDTALASYAQPGDQDISPGDLARATLQHLAATRPDLVPVITQAIELPDPGLREPITLVGALVILALQTEVKLSRNTSGRWAFTIHKQPMRDSTLGQVISKLLAYLPGGR